MEAQAYHIQVLLADELDRCRKKGNTHANNHIRKIQDAYQNESQKVKIQKTINKGK